MSFGKILTLLEKVFGGPACGDCGQKWDDPEGLQEGFKYNKKNPPFKFKTLENFKKLEEVDDLNSNESTKKENPQDTPYNWNKNWQKQIKKLNPK
jgi:hypothetical protein